MMRPRLATFAAGAVLAATFAACCLALIASRQPEPGSPVVAPLDAAVWLFPWIMFAVVGALVVERRPGHPIGWILVAIGFVQTAGTAFAGGIRILYAVPRWHDVAPWLLALVPQGGPIAYFLIAVLLMLFPDGRLPSRRWRWLTGVLAAATCLLWAGALLSPQPQMPGLPPSPLANARLAAVVVPVTSFDAVALYLLAPAAALVVRYRSGSETIQHQVKWFGLGTATLLASAALGGVLEATLHLADVQTVLLTVGLAAVPVSIAIAILRHRVFDIDLIVSRALAYGGLAAAATALYVGLVVGVASLLGRTANLDVLLSVLATAAVALAFQPLRIGLLGAANRVVYGRRQTPYEWLAGFTRQLAHTHTMEEVLSEMAEAVGRGTRAQAAAVLMQIGGHFEVAAAWPSRAKPPPRAPDHTVDVLHHGEKLGWLAVWTHQSQALYKAETRLLSDLALQAGLVMRNVVLNAELARRLEELSASRRRLVAAQDEERRRIERDLHDGAQHDLVALRMRLGLLEEAAAGGGPQLSAMIADLRRDSSGALESVRRLSRGLYPALLESQGLGPALTAHSRRLPLPVEVRAPGGRFPREVETAVYFCCAEALQNAAKHACAGRAWIQVDAADGRLEFEVGDDGRGFDVARAGSGSGLQNISDRMEALGGAVKVRAAETGTVLTGWAPIS